MPPANNTFATAVTIGAFPYDVTQTDINDAGVNYTVYYRFLAPANSRVIGAWGYGGTVGVGYRPRCRPYDGPAGAPVAILSILGGNNDPIQFPVVPGQEYFLEFQKNADTAGPESLRVQVEVAPLDTISPGNILVNDDTNGFPMAVLSQDADDTVINFVKDIAAGEAGDIWAEILCLEKANDNTIRVYDADFVEIGNLSAAAGTPRIRTCIGLQKFFFANSRNPVPIRDILLDGTYGAVNLTTTWTNVLGFAVSNDGLIAYSASTAAASAIRQWDLTLNVAMADLVAGIAGEDIVDILVLSDDSIVALGQVFATGVVTVRRYSEAGVLQNTYSIGVSVEPAGTYDRLAYALDDPDSFWVWHHPSTGVSEFFNIRASDGTIITDRLQTEYETGGYQQAETATPTSRFGNSFSCPFMIMTGAAPPTTYSGIYIFEPNKVNDTVNDGGEELDVAIPTPTFRTGLLG